MTIEDTTENDLREFLAWFADWHGRTSVADSVMTTCMTGYFKTHSRAADKLLMRCKRLKLVAVDDAVVAGPVS